MGRIVGIRQKELYIETLKESNVPFSVKRVGKSTWEFTIKKRCRKKKGGKNGKKNTKDMNEIKCHLVGGKTPAHKCPLVTANCFGITHGAIPPIK